jgi:hypothetical protein
MSEPYSTEYFSDQIEKMRLVVSRFLKGYKTVAELMSEPQKITEFAQVKREQGRNK